MQAIVFGWYDGLTDGVATTKGQPEAYRFQLLSWDSKQDMRVYSLTRLNHALFEKMANLLATWDPPHWPIWVVKWPLGSEQVKALEAQLEPLLTADSLPDYVIATRDLTHSIDHGRTLDSASAKEKFRTLRNQRAPFVEWLRFAGGH